MKPWLGIIGRLVFLLLTIIVLFGWVFGITRVSGVAMHPNLKDGELILYTRWGGDYKTNDVVLYKHDGKEYISRVLAREDQIVDVNREGYLTVDGVVESDNVVFDVKNDSDAIAAFPFRVPSGSYFVLNDNYEYNEDSRSFGAIDARDIYGCAISSLKVRDI